MQKALNTLLGRYRCLCPKTPTRRALNLEQHTLQLVHDDQNHNRQHLVVMRDRIAITMR